MGRLIVLNCTPMRKQESEPAGTEEPCDLPATELARLLRGRQLSAREAVTAHLARLERTNGLINAVVTVTAEAALRAAARADDHLAGPGGTPLGPLHGVPVVHKDLQDTAGVRTTYGSPLYAAHVPAASSPLVVRVAAAGAISLGKSNTPEFGAGSHTYNPVFGPTRNPWDPTRSAGGSSGGAAAALAAGMVPLADGSDMGGSLRNPASFCNVFGFRPSVALLPPEPAERGLAGLSVDGPMARGVDDALLLLEVLTAGSLPAAAVAHLDDLRGRRIAWCPRPGGVPVDPAVRAALAPVPDLLVALGAEVVEDGPDLAGADEVFGTLRAWSFATSLAAEYAQHRDALKPEVVWNVELGRRLRGADLARALRVRADLVRRVDAWMSGFDALALPAAQVAPFPVGEAWPTVVDGTPMGSYLDWMRACTLVSATGLPAASVPFAFTAASLPVGLQLAGRRGGDAALLAVAGLVERAAGASRRRPPLPGAG